MYVVTAAPVVYYWSFLPFGGKAVVSATSLGNSSFTRGASDSFFISGLLTVPFLIAGPFFTVFFSSILEAAFTGVDCAAAKPLSAKISAAAKIHFFMVKRFVMMKRATAKIAQIPGHSKFEQVDFYDFSHESPTLTPMEITSVER